VTAADLLARGRARAEELMTDTVTITRITGPPGPVDPDTGEREPAPTMTVYAGPGKIQTYEPHESARKSGEHIYIEQRYHLHLPISATEADVGDSVTVTSSATDAQLVGREYRVAGEHAKTWATARRLLLDEITG
jgi:hypothetical protein